MPGCTHVQRWFLVDLVHATRQRDHRAIYFFVGVGNTDEAEERREFREFRELSLSYCARPSSRISSVSVALCRSPDG